MSSNNTVPNTLPKSTGVRKWVREHQLTAGVGLWALVLAGTGIYVWRKPIPTSLKVIHARMVAQAGVIMGLCGAGLLSLLAPEHTEHPHVVNKVSFRETKGTARLAEASALVAPPAPLKE